MKDETNMKTQAKVTKNEAKTRPGIELKSCALLHWQPETLKQARKVPVGTVSGAAHLRGMANAEPLIVMLDALLRYAKAYEKRFEGDKLASDGVLGVAWLDAIRGVKTLLGCDGAVAMVTGWTTDSKANSACEGMFWEALKVAGFGEGDL